MIQAPSEQVTMAQQHRSPGSGVDVVGQWSRWAIPKAVRFRELFMPRRFRQVCWHELPERSPEDSYSPMTFELQFT